jgi:hypothetical protein
MAKDKTSKRSTADLGSTDPETTDPADEPQENASPPETTPTEPPKLETAEREGDPLTDPDTFARTRAQGRTSDAAARSADIRAGDVAPDLNDAVDKPSDAGPDQYPFPPGGDVEQATVDAGSGADELQAPLSVEDWVVLGDGEDIPERLHGRRAAVIDPRDAGVPWSEDDASDTFVQVRTRDEVNATLTIPLSDVAEIVRGGRDVTVRG